MSCVKISEYKAKFYFLKSGKKNLEWFHQDEKDEYSPRSDVGFTIGTTLISDKEVIEELFCGVSPNPHSTYREMY